MYIHLSLLCRLPRYGTALQTGLAKLSVNTNQEPHAQPQYDRTEIAHTRTEQVRRTFSGSLYPCV